MKRASIRVWEPTPELIEIIRRARAAISQQKPRYLKCPGCGGNLNFDFNQNNHDIKLFQLPKSQLWQSQVQQDALYPAGLFGAGRFA